MWRLQIQRAHVEEIKANLILHPGHCIVVEDFVSRYDFAGLVCLIILTSSKNYRKQSQQPDFCHLWLHGAGGHGKTHNQQLLR